MEKMCVQSFASHKPQDTIVVTYQNIWFIAAPEEDLRKLLEHLSPYDGQRSLREDAFSPSNGNQ